MTGPERSHPPRCSLALLLALALAFASTASTAESRPNVLFLAIDDLRPELRSFGVDYIHSPNIDRLAASGRIFTRHYVQAPTCGASRSALWTGRYGPAGNGALFERARRLSRAPETVPPSLPAHLRANGYTTVSIGKVTHHPGGRGGPDWNDPAQSEMPLSWDRHLAPAGLWQHPRGAMHGLARGEIRRRAGNMAVYQSVEGDDSIYPDGLTTDAALRELTRLAKAGPDGERSPFFLAVGIVRPHLPFGAPARYMEPYRNVELPPIPHPQKPAGKTTWHASGEFMKYGRQGRDPRKDPEFANLVRKHYAACVTYADAQVGRILAQLERLGLDDETIVILWGDHGWHLGEHAIWGKHSLFEESLRSPLIVRAPALAQPGLASDAVVETIDIFPTVCELLGVETPERLDGTSLLPQLREPTTRGRSAISYQSRAATIRTDRYRLVRHDAKANGVAASHELYDHASEAGETRNIATENASLVLQLARRLRLRRDRAR